MAPCSHVWHYKCIRSVIYPNWPNFQCPNCRAYADLEAEVDQPEDDDEEEEEYEQVEEEEDDDDEEGSDKTTKQSDHLPRSTDTANEAAGSEDDELNNMMHGVSVREPTGSDNPPAESSSSGSGSGSDGEAEAGPSASSTSNPMPIVASTDAPINTTLPESIMARSATPTSHAQFALAAGLHGDAGGPATPMNDSGPFIFDGSSSNRGSRPVDDMAREPVGEETEESLA